MPASRDVRVALEAMDKIARKCPVAIAQTGRSNARTEAIGLINNVARSAFPEPFQAVIFVGGKQMNAADPGGETWSGFMEISSMQLGLEAEFGEGAGGRNRS